LLSPRSKLLSLITLFTPITTITTLWHSLTNRHLPKFIIINQLHRPFFGLDLFNFIAPKSFYLEKLTKVIGLLLRYRLFLFLFLCKNLPNEYSLLYRDLICNILFTLNYIYFIFIITLNSSFCI
jgi:hypothetical protein